ncbi:MAG: alpha/beta hydrolase [Akkermansiaceae bacterium]
MKNYLFYALALMLVVPVFGQGSDKEGLKKYNWTLGYTPDKVIDYYAPVPDQKLKLHLFLPEGYEASDKRPCVIFFFGGGWSGGDPSQFFGYSKYLASRGMVAISAQYRTKAQKAIPRNCVEDGREAVRYVRKHAVELGVDPNQIAVGGGSAGGHVAAAIAMCPKIDVDPDSEISSMPNALLLYNPVYNNGPGGYGHERVKDYWEDISPHHNIVKGLPPTIAFFGSKDKHVPVATINAFQAAMEKVGNESASHIYEGQTHGFFHISKGGRAMFEDVLTKTDAFLVKQKFLTGEDNVKVWTAQAIEHYKSTRPRKKTKVK